MKCTLDGIYPALVTPFSATGELDCQLAGPLIEKLIDSGVNGFYVGGSTGEGFLQSVDERQRFLQYVSKINSGRVTLIAQVGTLASHESWLLSEYAAEYGYDVVSSTPPFYYGYTEEEVFTYYEDIAVRSKLPLLLYNAPHTTGVSLPLSAQKRLLEIPGVIGSKHTDSNLYVAEQLLSSSPGKFLMNGPDEMLTAGLAMGMQGGIGATYNLMPRYFVDIYNYVKSGDLDKARHSQSQVNAVIAELLHISPCVIAGIKCALHRLGYDVGIARKPLLPIRKNPDRLVSLLSDMGCI